MGKTYDNNEINGDSHVHDLLSAYIDKSLEDTERGRVRAHLEECIDCRADYVELQATQRMLQQMPAVAVPRAFTLTPEMVKGSRKVSLLERIFAPRTAPTFASGAVVAFGLLLFLFISSLTSNPSLSPSTTALESSPPADVMRNAATSEADTQAGNTGLAEEPTSTTAVAAAPVEDTAAGKQSPTQPSEAALQPPGGMAGTPLPASTPLPAGGQGGEAQIAPQITPNTDIAGSDTGSPTTTSLYFNPEPSEDAAGVAPLEPNTDTDAITQPSAAPVPIVEKFDFFLAVEIGLLVLGLALAGAYLIARRS